MNQPSDIAFDAAGNLYIADRVNNRIRRVDAVTGVITTVAGNGGTGNTGDGGKATKAQVGFPIGIVVDAAGNVYFGTSGLIRRVDAVTGRISTIAVAATPPTAWATTARPRRPPSTPEGWPSTTTATC